ncbi:hypothetical protein NIES4103_17580 [Nostoc sp. NIES-4103]|nr:hypothetical protein NIES4103_17580 [Nostoc sp. NIES-4103]
MTKLSIHELPLALAKLIFSVTQVLLQLIIPIVFCCMRFRSWLALYQVILLDIALLWSVLCQRPSQPITGIACLLK